MEKVRRELLLNRYFDLVQLWSICRPSWPWKLLMGVHWRQCEAQGRKENGFSAIIKRIGKRGIAGRWNRPLLPVKGAGYPLSTPQFSNTGTVNHIACNTRTWFFRCIHCCPVHYMLKLLICIENLISLRSARHCLSIYLLFLGEP